MHDTLLVVTWDEGLDPDNTIATIFYGPKLVRPGRYAEPITHYTVLRTLETMFGLPPTGHAKEASPITDIWR